MTTRLPRRALLRGALLAPLALALACGSDPRPRC
jgi:hypothetical protein